MTNPLKKDTRIMLAHTMQYVGLDK